MEHIPRRGRVSKLSWLREPVPVSVRGCSESELKLAFQIERFGGDGPIRVYLENGNLWWPVGSGGPDLDRFLGSLRRGYRGVIGLIGARIRESYKWRIKDKIKSREVLYSWRDDALGRAHLAAQNILLVDGNRAYIRGAIPCCLFMAPETFRMKPIWMPAIRGSSMDGHFQSNFPRTKARIGTRRLMCVCSLREDKCCRWSRTI